MGVIAARRISVAKASGVSDLEDAASTKRAAVSVLNLVMRRVVIRTTYHGLISRSRLLHERIDDLLLAGLVEGDDELVAFDGADLAVTELLVEDASALRPA